MESGKYFQLVYTTKGYLTNQMEKARRYTEKQSKLCEKIKVMQKHQSYIDKVTKQQLEKQEKRKGKRKAGHNSVALETSFLAKESSKFFGLICKQDLALSLSEAN